MDAPERNSDDTPATHTPRERVAAGEIVRFDELTTEELRAMFPKFGEIWQRVTGNMQFTVPESEDDV